MNILWIILGSTVLIMTIVLVIAYICFRMAFYVPDRTPSQVQTTTFPNDEVYGPYLDTLETWLNETEATPHEEFSITSFDGLKLYGNYYEYKKGAPIELMFHGYKGSAKRDLCGGIQRCFALERSAFIVDQRCSQKSEGNVITFGINEHKDCLRWVDLMIEHFGPDVKIILTGISMGAATVLMAAGNPLPPNVVGVLADCGYNSPKDIIKIVIKQMGLPASLSYFFVKLGARIYGHFDLEETSPETALKKCTVPVIFFHGESDGYVPCEMSRINYDACASKKCLVTIPGADHGLSFPKDPEIYLKSLKDFFG